MIPRRLNILASRAICPILITCGRSRNASWALPLLEKQRWISILLRATQDGSSFMSYHSSILEDNIERLNSTISLPNIRPLKPVCEYTRKVFVVSERHNGLIDLTRLRFLRTCMMGLVTWDQQEGRPSRTSRKTYRGEHSDHSWSHNAKATKNRG